MIVHVFNGRVSLLQKLPTTASGMYPLQIDGRTIANILAVDNGWVARLSPGYVASGTYIENFRLLPYQVCTITSQLTGEVFFLVATPRYSLNTLTFNIQGQITIGSDPNCEIVYAIDFSNSEFLRLQQNGANWTAETNSPHYFISGERITNGQLIRNGDCIFFYGLKIIVINSKLILEAPNERIQSRLSPNAVGSTQPPIEAEPVEVQEDLPLYTEADYFYKPPRLNYIIEPAEVEIDEPPEPVKGNEVPAILTVGPQITMAGASAISMVSLITQFNSDSASGSKMGFSIATMTITLVGTLIWPFITKAFNKHRLKKREQKRQKKYSEYLKQKQHLITFIKANQKQTLLENHPDPTRCESIVENHSRELWQRSVGHEDFLTVRMGLGRVPTKIEVNKPKERFSIDDDDALFLAMKRVVTESLYLTDAPITYNLTERPINAVVGEATAVKSFIDCLFLQILTFHSYTDLKVVIFTKEPHKWEYLKTIPHCWNAQHTVRYFTSTLDRFSTISTELEKVFDARVADDEEVKLEDDGERHDSQTNFKDFRPYYLFLIDDMSAVRNVPLVNKILHYKRNLGFSIIATAQNISTLPNETTNFICISRNTSTVITSDNNSNDEDTFKADFNDGSVDMLLYAQKIANIPVLAEKGKFELPASISFLGLYNFGRVEQLNSLARWQSNNPSLSLSVPIGIDQNDEIFQMDIHEKAFGPHGLIAGTTGSGKSEWIVTYILSLAVNFSPDEVQFVLIDYKGGGLAKSFENSELGIKLPHLAGTITNLDKSEIFRSISAIESELKRRQAVFNTAREKLKEGSMNIYKYQQYYRRGLVDEPMSHLLIICDEFAELKSQEPEFMDQLISTSRIGRSLGVHLILATQKPSGVVNDQIWSNSKFKVCLKVQDRSDSNEILKKPDAAYLKQTGTFYLQVGNDDYFNLGQVAWAGAKYYPSDVVEHKVDTSLQCIDETGQIIETLDPETTVTREDQGEELLNIVAYISETSKQIELKKRQLWLENVPTRILLSNLRKKYQIQAPEKYTYNTVIGEYDEPRRQEQGPLCVDLSAGNIAIIGRADTSIESLISTIVWSSLCDHTPAEIAYYIIDFGSETMKKFAKFPHVGEVVFQDEIDRVAGVLGLVQEEMEHRKDLLSEYNGSFEYYNKTAPEKLPIISVVINNYDIFGETLPRSLDAMSEMFRDAPRYGINFIVSSNATNALGPRQLQYFNHVILMQLTDDGQYRNISNCRRGLIPKKVVGRGICKLDSTDDDSYCEFQTAIIAPEDKELDIIKAYANQCTNYYQCKVKQLTKVPDDVTSDDLVKSITDLSHLPIGYNLYEKDVAMLDLLASKVHLITAKSLREHLGFIYALTSLCSQVPNVKVRVVDLLGIFQKPLLDIKLFNDNLDVTFGALEKDVLTRTETQDYGINIIIGAGQYKKQLSAGGIEIYQNLFAKLPQSKKSIYLLLDDYDNLRALKLENWFSTIDTSQGLWLGTGLSSQSLLTCQPLSAEDKKHDFAGLAYNITNGQYQVVKTMLDEDN